MTARLAELRALVSRERCSGCGVERDQHAEAYGEPAYFVRVSDHEPEMPERCGEWTRDPVTAEQRAIEELLDAHAAALARAEEAEAALLNERGEGQPPSPEWRPGVYSASGWSADCADGDVAYVEREDPADEPPRWRWCFDRRHATGTAPTARETMRAARRALAIADTRRPLPVEVLASASTDRVHRDVGRGRAVRIKRTAATGGGGETS